MQKTTSAFTTVEIIVAIVLSGMVMIGLLPTIVHMFTGQYQQIARAKQMTEVHEAAANIMNDLRRTRSYRRTPNASDTAAPAPSGGWHFKGDGPDQRTLILTLPATTKIIQYPSRELVTIAKTPLQCEKNFTKVLFYTVVYYLHDSTLYKRDIVQIPPGYIACNGTWPHQQTTSNSGSGPKDLVILRDVTAFAVDYYSSTDTIPDASAYDSTSIHDNLKTTPLNYNHVSVSVTTKKIIDDKESLYSQTIRYSL